MKSKILMVTGLLLFALLVAPINVYANGCPAFTSSMIDAAFLATEYSQVDPVVGEANDSPNAPSIFCEFTNDDDGYFVVFVGYEDDFEPPGNIAHLIGSSPVNALPEFDTYMRTLVPNLTEAEVRACRAQVLASFTWKQHCKALMD